MKIKEFVEVLKETEFVCRVNAFAGSSERFLSYEGISNFSLDEFGKWLYGWNWGERDFIIIEKNSKVYKKYKKLSELLKDEEVMEMEIIKIRKIQLFADYAQSTTSNNWPDNKSKIEICVI